MARNIQVNLVRLLKRLRHLIRQLADDSNASCMEPGGDGVHILLPLIMGDIVQFIVVKTSTDIQDYDLCSTRDRGINPLKHVRCSIAFKSRVDDANVVTPCL